MKVGFIGLGAMGLPMATARRRCGSSDLTTSIAAANPPTSWRRRARPFSSRQPKSPEPPTSSSRSCRPTSELKEAVLGDEGMLLGFAPGKVLIDMTSATALIMEDVERAVAGGGRGSARRAGERRYPGRRAGHLTIMVGGDAKLLERCRPLLEAMGQKIVHVGPVGQGKVVKMVNQMMAAAHLVMIGEAFALGIRCGADPAYALRRHQDILGIFEDDGLAAARVPAGRHVRSGFRLDLMKKDVNLAIDSARR